MLHIFDANRHRRLRNASPHTHRSSLQIHLRHPDALPRLACARFGCVDAGQGDAYGGDFGRIGGGGGGEGCYFRSGAGG